VACVEVCVEHTDRPASLRLESLAEKGVNLSPDAIGHLKAQSIPRHFWGLLVGLEEFDAFRTISQVTVEAFSVLGRQRAAEVVHAVVDQLTAADSDDFFVRLHHSGFLVT
jgi:hypothetical protein